MEQCNICPRKCKADRVKTFGFCKMGKTPKISKVMLHKWEEPCISGTNGSGTVFFSGCNLRCVFCQNFMISQQESGEEVSIARLADIFLSLEAQGAHNINLVNPTHFIPSISQTIEICRNRGLKIPIVYNSNGYECVDALKLLSGKIQVYLPDIKYYDKDASFKYSGVADYFEVCKDAILEMFKQVGIPTFNKCGIIKKGLVIRHLILPSLSKDSMKVLDFISNNLPEDIFISIMSQYIPYFKASEFKEINRKITKFEYKRVLDHFEELGFINGYMQEMESASQSYIPDF